MRIPRQALAALLLWAATAMPAQAEPCNGRFLNPITDICWECILPFEIVSPYVCLCPAPWPVLVRLGIVFQFWEPVWLVDVTREPYCFVNMDFGIDFGLFAPEGTIQDARDAKNPSAFYQLHIYENFFWSASLGLTVDAACKLMYSGGPNYSVEWFTELDPLWMNDELAFILAPESALFANPVAQTACAADCAAATVGDPIDTLFWCAGCQGSLYPMGGNVDDHTGGVMASTLLTERLVAKMHRQLIAWDTTSDHCGNDLGPLIKKSQYRLQITYPIPATVDGCPAFGASEVPRAAGQEIPYKGEDFGYLVWRQRKCCVSY